MGLPEAAPGFGDEDAVAGVAGVVADLDGLVDAVAEDAVGQERDVLGAVVGDSGETVAVEKNLWSGGDAVFAVEGTGVYEVAVGDAADGGDVFAAATLQLFGGRAAGADDEVGGCASDDDAGSDAAEDAGIVVLEQLRELVEGTFHGIDIRIARRGTECSE